MADDILTEAREAYSDAWDAAAEWMRAADDALRFYTGDQWPNDERTRRSEARRLTFTFNRLPQYVRQVINDARIRRPSIKVMPVDDVADPQVAEVLEGLIRHIEADSNADYAYIRALEHAVVCGMGHFRIVTEYDGDDLDQIVRIRPVIDPLAVVWDASAYDPQRRDARYCFVTERLSKKRFEQLYPDASPASWEGLSASAPAWYSADEVMIAEYWRVEEQNRKRIILRGGGGVWRDEIDDETLAQLAERDMIYAERDVSVPRVTQTLLAAHDVLSETTEWAGRYLPIVPVIGEELMVGGRLMRYGLVHHARDAQLLYNLHRSAMAEVLAMAPKPKWLVTPQQIATHEREWAAANTTPFAYLLFNPDPQSPGPPQRIAPEVPAAGLLQDATLSAADIEATIGIYRANLGAPSNESSGRAILARQREGDVSTFHFVDNLARAVAQCGRILVDLIPRVYDTERVVRVLGEDGAQKLVRINQALPEPGRRALDLSVGRYDVVAEAGLSYSTRREEAREGMMAFMQAVPSMAALVGDLFAHAQDWPKADEIAKRIRAALIRQGMLQPDETDAAEGRVPQPQPSVEQILAQAELMKAQNRAREIEIDAEMKSRELAIKEAELGIKARRARDDAEAKAIDLATKAVRVTDEGNERAARAAAQTIKAFTGR